VTDTDRLLAEQRDYYRARAAEYDDWWRRTGSCFRSDRHSVEWRREVAEAQAWLAGRGIGGDVLELAGGTGNWTVEIERLADTLTVVDSSPETLEINRTKLTEPDAVDYVVADVFEYRPPRRFDAVVFSFWLSHVPAARFEGFWNLVERCLWPGGLVVMIDSAHPSLTRHAPDSGLALTSRPTEYGGQQGAISISDGVAERVLDDGSTHRVVKRYWMPDRFEAEMADLGWHARARNTRYFFLLADLDPASATSD